jgi:hypothetical protein
MANSHQQSQLTHFVNQLHRLTGIGRILVFGNPPAPHLADGIGT